MIMIDMDMHMPDNCDECRFNTEYGFCKAMPENFCGNTDDRKRPEWCPLKDHEAVEPYSMNAERTYGICPNCGKLVFRYGNVEENHYCGVCGQAVKWRRLENEL